MYYSVVEGTTYLTVTFAPDVVLRTVLRTYVETRIIIHPAARCVAACSRVLWPCQKSVGYSPSPFREILEHLANFIKLGHNSTDSLQQGNELAGIDSSRNVRVLAEARTLVLLQPRS